MLLSALGGGGLAGITAFFLTGNDGLPLAVPFLTFVVAGFLIPVLFVAGLVPSAFVFALLLRIFRRRYAMRTAAQWAGTMTSIVAGITLTFVLSDFGQDWDGAAAAMLFVGPAAILISPVVAGYLYT